MKLIPSRAPLNIVPFIDIMLVLLCMVLSVSTFIARGEIRVNLPDAQTQNKLTDAEASLKLLEIGENNEIFFDGRKVTRGELLQEINNLKADAHLELRIDEKADFGLFAAVLDQLREKRHENFSIATEKAEL
jgi:biopolymer transport protein ExbD